jgi:signal transduction histidine kinase/CheY-like chemotaxis protein
MELTLPSQSKITRFFATEVLAAVVDREGSVWLGYTGHGLARRLGQNQWESFTEQEGLGDLAIWRVVRDRAGDLWLGTTHGLFHGTQAAGQWRFKRVNEIGDLSIYAMEAGPDGSLWIGAYQTKVNGLIRFNPKTRAKRIYPPPQDWPPFSINAVSQDETGTIWVATSHGLLRLLPGAVELERYPTPLDGATVFDVRSTPQGLFAGGKKGLYVEKGQMRRLLTTADGLRDDVVQSVYPLPDGSLWLDYFSPDGISCLRFAGTSLQMQHFSTGDGLPSDIIYGQFFDASGRHWVTTDNGAAVLEGGHWVHYDTSNGLVWNDCNTHSFLAGADGSVWIGTSGGLAHYRPAALQDAVLPATLITSVLRNDQPAQSMDFDAQTRALGLRFTMLSYLNQNPRFRYRIGGSSSPWSQTTGHEVRLAELAPGTYDFVVQGEASPGVWSTPASLHFRIRAPWYLSRPWQAAFGAVIAACFWLWWRNREQRQARVREQLERAVTERTRDLAEATRRAEQASRVKGEFVANISHEMRTPLNGVLGLTQLALELTRDAEVAEHLRIAQFSARGLLSLINDVLDFSKLEAGEMQIFPVVFELRPLLRDLRSMFAQEAVRQGLRLEVAIEADVPQWVLADEGRLRQVLLNLVGNALKFTLAGSVTVGIKRRENGLQFSVADTGIGIPADKQALIFDAFRQADNSTSRRHGGTGLGLTISKRLVESMGGELALESAPNVGSTFTFTVPAPEATPVAPPSGPPNEPPASPMHILVAEDNRVNQHLILALLKKLGHSAEVAWNGLEVLDALPGGLFDLVLMDIQMPELDGLQATRKIRELESGTSEHLPIVALTARAMPGDRELFLSSGMDDYLEKPIQEQRFHEVLNRMSRLVRARG